MSPHGERAEVSGYYLSLRSSVFTAGYNQYDHPCHYIYCTRSVNRARIANMFGLPFHEPAWYIFGMLEGKSKNKNKTNQSAGGASEKK